MKLFKIAQFTGSYLKDQLEKRIFVRALSAQT